MADSSVLIDQGSTTAMDTRTEATNGNHRQVIVIGDPATNAGVAPVDATAGLKVDLGADNDVTVSGSVAVTNAGLTELAAAIDTEVQCDIVGALPAGTNNIGDVDILSIAAGDNNIGNVDVVTLPSLPAGTNAIGKLAANSGVDIGDVDVTSVSGNVTVVQGTGSNLHTVVDSGTITTVSTVTAVTAISNALPAGTNLVGHVGHGQTPKVKTGSASATFTIVAAVASNKIKVYSLSLMTASATAVTITFKDGAAGTVIGTYILQAITGTNFGIAENVPIPSSLFETSVNTLLEMSFSGAVSVTYNLRYFEQA